MNPEKKPNLRKSTFVEPDKSGIGALDVLSGLKSPISEGLAEGVRRITKKRDGCPTSVFVEPSKSGDKALNLARKMESPIAAGLRDGGKNRKDL